MHSTATNIEYELRALWTAQGVPTEWQDQLIVQIAAKASPGAHVGLFTIPGSASHGDAG
jgi:hypothetical protein